MCRWGCSPTRSCRRPTSCSTGRSGCRSARTSASTSSSAATWRGASTAGSATRCVVPEPHILARVAKIYDLQQVEKQMSKSVGGNGVVWMLDDPKVVEKKIKSAVTDTGREVRFDPGDKPGVSNLLAILSAFGGESVDDLEARFAGAGYGDLKKGVVEAVLDVARPVPGAGQRLPGRPGRARRRPRRAAPSAPARSRPARCRRLRQGRLPAGCSTADDSREHQDHRRRDRDPRAARRRAAAGPRGVRRPDGARRSRPTSPCCRRPRSPPTTSTTSRSTCARSPSPSSRSRSTCAAPGPSTRCRRSSSSRSCPASVTASGWSRGCGPARWRRDLAFPYHPHVTVAHDLPERRAGPRLRRDGRRTTCVSRCGASASTSTARTRCGGRSATSRSGSTCPVRRGV